MHENQNAKKEATMLKDQEEEEYTHTLEEKIAVKVIAKFPLGLGTIVLSAYEWFRDLFSKEPPFTSIGLSNRKSDDNEIKKKAAP